MIILWSLYVILLGWNRMFASSSVLTLLNEDGNLRVLKKPPNEFEYVLKRHGGVVNVPEEPDSKERRSNMGSSFIRFGRGQTASNLENSAAFLTGDNQEEQTVSRHPRWKNPDIVIRFGRSGPKSLTADRVFKRGRDDRNFIRFGRDNNEVRVLPAFLDLSTACSEVMSSDLSNVHTNSGASARDLRQYMSMLIHLCELTNNDGLRNTNELSFLNDNRVDTKQE